MDPPDPVVEASVNEGSKMVLDHTIHSFYQDGVFRLEQIVTWVNPLLNRLFYESPCDHEWIVVRELACLGPVFHVSNRVVNEGQCNSL